MKIKSIRRRQEQGSALLVTLIFGVILLTASASYMMLVGTQKKVVTRSQTWNAAINLAEAGVEEALAHVNSLPIFKDYNSFTNFGNTNLPPQNFSTNGWGQTGSVFGPMSRSLLGGNYTVTVHTNDITPTIYSTGYTTVPITGDSIPRMVRVTTQVARLSNVGIGAVGDIDLNGMNLFSDSYNSHLPSLSTDGAYDSTKTSTNGDVACISGLVDVGNRDIKGDVYLGPTASYTGSGTLTGTKYTDFNVQFPDVELPAGAASWTSAAVTNLPTLVRGRLQPIETYHFQASGNYRVSLDRPIVVEPGVTVVLNVVSTGLDLTKLKINGGPTSSGTLVLYVNGPSSITVSGNQSVGDSRPENLWIFGLPTLTSITWDGNSDFVGVIYAPQADIILNGMPGNGMMGSVIGASITSNGNAAIHFDEALTNLGPIRGYVASSWQEL